MELFKLFGTIAIENDKANKAIDETTGKAEKSESKIASAFKKIGSAVVTYMAADKIKDFGMECVEAAASVKAMDSQFEQTFGNLADLAGNAIARVADSSNILDTRLQGIGTSIYAFAKTSGMESEEALGMMERALKATADSAAYYDRSLEETSESLKSFLKGNFENDAALGLSCTETTRNAAANELYGKSFKNLSEAQKQLTLLKMVEDANELSGAMGQAAREGEGWENVTGNLRESWTQFLAVIGLPLLNLLVPAIQKITVGISGLGEKAGELIDLISDGEKRSLLFKNALNSIFSSDFLANAEEWIFYLNDIIRIFAGNTAEMFTGKIHEIQQIFLSLGDVIRPLAETVLNGLFHAFDNLLVIWNDVLIPVVSMVIDIFTDFASEILRSITPAIQQITEKFQQLQQFISAAVQNYILPVITAFIDMIRELWEENQDKITLIGELFQTVFQTIANLVSGFMDTFKNYIYPFIGWLVAIIQENMDSIKSVFQSAFDIIGSIVEFFIALFKGDWTGMWESVKNILEKGIQFFKNIFGTLKNILGAVFKPVIEKVTSIFNDIKKVIIDKITAVKQSLTETFENIKKTVSDKLNAAKQVIADIFISISSTLSEAWETIVNVVSGSIRFIGELIGLAFDIITLPFQFIWQNCKEYVLAAWETITTYISEKLGEVSAFLSEKLTAIKEFFGGIWEDISDYVGEKLAVIQEVVNEKLTAVKEFFNSRWEGITSYISEKLISISEFISETWNGILSTIQEIWNDIYSCISEKIGKVIAEVKKKFEEIRKKVSEKMDEIWSKISDKWEEIKTTFTTKMSSIVSKVEEKFEEMKERIEEKINGAKEKVREAIETIKGFFDFEWKLPDLKTPHFSIDGEFNLLEGKVPSIDIEWYKKGAVLTKPTVFGMNPVTGNIMAGGEAGAEAVAPISTLQNYVAEAVASQNTGIIAVLQKILAVICSMDDGMKETFMEALENMRFDIDNREFARLVKSV